MRQLAKGTKKPKGLRGHLRQMGVKRVHIFYPTSTVKALMAAWLEAKDIYALSQAQKNGKFVLINDLMEVTAVMPPLVI